MALKFYNYQKVCNMLTGGGYEVFTTFGNDFDICDQIADTQKAIKAIEETYGRAFREWKSNYKYITEFCMTLNWKCWLWSAEIPENIHPTNEEISETYAKLYYKCDSWCLDNLKGEAKDYYTNITN